MSAGVPSKRAAASEVRSRRTVKNNGERSMKRCATLILFAGLFAVAQAAPAPETITIKFRLTNEGDCNLVEKQENRTMKSKFVDADGKVVSEQTTTEVTTTEFKETLLRRVENKRPLKIEREYTRAEAKKGDMTEELGLKGKTVVIEWKDDKYTYTFKGGGEVTGAAAEVLAKEFADKTDDDDAVQRALLPKSTVRTGEEWKLDMKPIIRSFSLENKIRADESAATGSGKLLKAYQKDGKEFGEIRYQLVIPVTSADNQFKFVEPGKCTIDTTMDLCIDGTSETGTIKAKVDFAGTVALPDPPGSTMKFSITAEQRISQKEVKK
jgi:hypothetical protein